jgi:hypothetical protein
MAGNFPAISNHTDRIVPSKKLPEINLSHLLDIGIEA